MVVLNDVKIPTGKKIFLPNCEISFPSPDNYLYKGHSVAHAHIKYPVYMNLAITNKYFIRSIKMKFHINKGKWYYCHKRFDLYGILMSESVYWGNHESPYYGNTKRPEFILHHWEVT